MVKRNILSLYKADIEKYAVGNEIKVKAIFSGLLSLLDVYRFDQDAGSYLPQSLSYLVR